MAMCSPTDPWRRQRCGPRPADGRRRQRQRSQCRHADHVDLGGAVDGQLGGHLQLRSQRPIRVAGQWPASLDNFDYTINDGNGGSDSATVTVTITGVNDTPVAQNDAYTLATGMGVQAYFNDFDGGEAFGSGISGTFGGGGAAEGVQGYSAYGYAGNFWRNKTRNPPVPTTLTLTNLPRTTASI